MAKTPKKSAAKNGVPAPEVVHDAGPSISDYLLGNIKKNPPGTPENADDSKLAPFLRQQKGALAPTA